jgi:hypothetical protein
VRRYILAQNCSSHEDCPYGTYCFDLEKYRTGEAWGGNGRCSALHDPYRCCGEDTDAIDRDRRACPAWLRCNSMPDVDNTVCGCEISFLNGIEFLMSAAQLTATASLFAAYRPPGMGASQTNLYFLVSVANNLVYHSCKIVM